MIQIIDTLQPLGNFPAVIAKHVAVGDLRLDEVLNASALELSKKANKEYVDEQIASIPQPDVTKSYVDSNFAKKTDIPAVPTKTSQLQNDSGFLTQHQSLSEYAKKTEIPVVPTKVSGFQNDAGYLTQHQDISGKADNDTVIEVTERVSYVETDTAILSARMDELVTRTPVSDDEWADARVGIDKTYPSIGGAIRGQVGALRTDLDMLSTQGKQFIDNNTSERYKLWTGNTTKAENSSWAGYYAVDAVSVPNGTYTFHDDVYIAQSYVEKGGVFTKFTDYFGISGTKWRGTITLSESVTLYISLFQNPNCRLTNGKFEGINIPFEAVTFAITIGKNVIIPQENVTGLSEINTAVKTIESEVSDVKGIIEIGKNKFDATAIIEGYYVNSAGKYIESPTLFASDKMHVKANQPYTVSNVSQGTFVYVAVFDADGVLKDYNNVSSSETFDGFTFTPEVDGYVVISSTIAARNSMQFEEGSERTALEKYRKVLSNTVDIKNAYNNSGFESGIEYAHVRDGELVCNNDHKNNVNVVAKYVQTDMGSPITKIMARIKVYNPNNLGDAMTAVIAGNLNTEHNISNITNKSVHLVFTKNHVTVGVFTNGTQNSVEIEYAELSHGGVYDVGFEFKGNDTITVYLPNGTTEDVTLSGIDARRGQYAIFEHYNMRVASTAVPTSNTPQNKFLGFYCTCTDGKPLKDNFKRDNGVLTVAPTGHVYKNYRNSSESDTMFDNCN